MRALTTPNSAGRFADRLSLAVSPAHTIHPSLIDPIAAVHASMRATGYTLAAILDYTCDDPDENGFSSIGRLTLRYTCAGREPVAICVGGSSAAIGIPCADLNRDRGI